MRGRAPALLPRVASLASLPGMDIASWWLRLATEDQQYLIANNGDEVREPLRSRVVAAGAVIGSPLWWSISDDPSDSTLADAVTDWIEAVANGETPMP